MISLTLLSVRRRDGDGGIRRRRRRRARYLKGREKSCLVVDLIEKNREL